mmetsp:Transcript_1040/g.1970  ORF Transcript_1040/g.1970 Transcript_1040/m.1970 type:complete len:176 (-) Transcript_1040:368-895(-)
MVGVGFVSLFATRTSGAVFRSGSFCGAMMKSPVAVPARSQVRMQYSDGFAARAPFPDKKLQVYVGNVSWGTTEETLYEAFAGAGEISSARIIKDRDTGRSRGFGFVTFVDEDSVEKAISMYDGLELDARNIRVSKSGDNQGRPRGPPRERSGGRYSDGGMGGGYGGRRGGMDDDF